MLAPQSESKPRELIPTGTYMARLYSIVELGTETYVWQGQENKSHKIHLTWELPTELKVFNEEKGEQPRVISESYGFSVAPKANLRNEVIHGMLGTSLTDTEAEGFDIDTLLGKECLISIVHKPTKKDPARMFEKILSISPLMKGQVCPPQINPTVKLYFANWDEEVFNKLNKFIQGKIIASPEYKEMTGVVEEINPDEIPF